VRAMGALMQCQGGLGGEIQQACGLRASRSKGPAGWGMGVDQHSRQRYAQATSEGCTQGLAASFPAGAPKLVDVQPATAGQGASWLAVLSINQLTPCAAHLADHLHHCTTAVLQSGTGRTFQIESLLAVGIDGGGWEEQGGAGLGHWEGALVPHHRAQLLTRLAGVGCTRRGG